MDDYNVNVLSEAKNEYSSRLVTILTPLMIEGVKSIFDEATKLCLDNDEEEKYLMTFQNLLNNIPKWSSEIVDVEKNRIETSSCCSYLEDLLTCVHITQLKSLTSSRAGLKQKKVDIDIPNLNSFIHKTYINVARKQWGLAYISALNTIPMFSELMDSVVTNLNTLNKWFRKVNKVGNFVSGAITKTQTFMPICTTLLFNPKSLNSVKPISTAPSTMALIIEPT